jgi:hypothetical protein
MIISGPIARDEASGRHRRGRRDDASSGRGLGLLLASVLGAALVVGSFVLVVWVRMAQLQGGYELYRLQRQKVRLLQERSQLEVAVSALKRPDRLALESARLGLQAPRADQVWREADELAVADTPVVEEVTP